MLQHANWMQQRFLLQILLLAQHVSGHHYDHNQELKSIIQWLLPVVFRAVVFKLLVWCGAEGYVSGLQVAAAYVEIKCQLDATEVFVADFITCSTCFGALLCPSSGAQEYYTVVAACGISCCGFQVAGLVWS